MLRPICVLLRAPLLLLLVRASGLARAADVSTLSTVPPATCKSLTDPSNTFINGLSLLNNVIGSASLKVDASVFSAVNKSLPALSRCVAATNPLALMDQFTNSSQRALTCLADLTALANSRSLFTTDGAVRFGDVFCPAFAKLTPCLLDLVLPALAKTLANTNGCCDPFLEQINAGFGSQLTPALTSLTHVVGNTFCSSRSTIAAPMTKTNCGDSLVANWMPHVADSAQTFQAVADSFQIPNAQVCRAARGDAFTTTVNTTQQFGAPSVSPYGLCYSPMDAMMQYARALPYWSTFGGPSTAAVVETLFGNDKCVKGADFLKWASSEDGAFLQGVRAADDALGLFTTLLVKKSNATPSPAPSVSTNATATPSPTVTTTPVPTTIVAPTPTPTPESTDDASQDDGSNDEQEEAELAVFDEAPESLPATSATSTTATNVATNAMAASLNLTSLVHSTLFELSLMSDKLCFHIPNGAQCSFPGDVLDVPFAQFAPAAVDSGSGSGGSATPSPSPQPSAAATTKPPTAGGNTNTGTTSDSPSTNSSTGSSQAVGMRQNHDSAVTAVVVTTLAAVLVHVL